MPCNAERIIATIAAAMRASRVSHRAAAERLGVSYAYVGRRLTGTTPMSLEDVLAFASLLELDLNELLDSASAGTVPLPALAANGPAAHASQGDA